ncbi:sulfate ABC transporter substrate-binding protein [Carnimonas nigrificans]|uniref:sulfate ABC transporter substrate-binding protein n=1 Tax=Carnimonas nigrificans TaxID=64323 RepID=UPI00046F9018|nr:sulfate ABC transporter substrate-binding protein [Carnimonas nigrificans]
MPARHVLASLFAASALGASLFAHAENVTLLNVSYDPTRELYQQYNKAFSQWYQKESGDSVSIQQSNGGSGSQSRSVIEGAPADVVTLALAYDIDAIADRNAGVPKDWQKQLPDNSSPYTSTIVFLVRKGNPKGIHDWGDLTKQGVEVITPNPKTSGGARWNFLAAWSWALKQKLGDLGKLHDPRYAEEMKAATAYARDYVRDLFKNASVLDSGARGSTNTFVKNGQGDVLIAWESDALLASEKLDKGNYEIVVPSLSILTEPPVAKVEGNVKRKGEAAEKAADAYLKHLYSPEGQRIIADNYYRPRNTDGIPQQELRLFPKLELVNVDEVFGGWAKAQKTFFADGGVFDQLQQR